MIESEMYSYLQDQSNITDLIGTRLYPDAAPQTAILPLIVYAKQSTDRNHTLRGAVGICTARIQLDVYGSSRTVCESIMDLVRLSVDGFQGNWGTTFIHLCKFDSESVSWDLETAKDTGIHQSTVDLVVTFTESITDFFGG
jgi:type II secretory pathway pseudopilin PulG